MILFGLCIVYLCVVFFIQLELMYLFFFSDIIKQYFFNKVMKIINFELVLKNRLGS